MTQTKFSKKPEMTQTKLSKKFVCFDISESASLVVKNELSDLEKSTVFWRAESLAANLYKSYQTKWEDPSGTTGEWSLPTVDKEITLHWRFEGVENGLPNFIIGHITTSARTMAGEIPGKFAVQAFFSSLRTKLGDFIHILKNIKSDIFYRKGSEESKTDFLPVNELDIRKDQSRNRELDNVLEKTSDISHENFLAAANASIQKLSNENK